MLLYQQLTDKILKVSIQPLFCPATELAKVVVEMEEHEPRLTTEEIVKERFISQFLPFAFKLTKGRTIDNVRARINDAWMKRPKHRSNP